ncbi:DMT family protein [Elioraea thermophila]|uniref:DMT family protein n=1 Tax=Elioraea thermophila TaxID=2185104 RepID=UPI000DF3B358|nr:DMT family protein [Elioraea thermophila]
MIPLPAPWMAWVLPPVLLVCSNVLMIYAWYWHLKKPDWPLWLAIVASWGIAFFEYCLAVPANRIGFGPYTAQQLKVMQEVITMTVFAGFAVWMLGEKLTWNYAAAAVCLVAAVVFIFLPVQK